MGCFTVILKPLGFLSTILLTRLLITIIVTDQDTDSKFCCACHWDPFAFLHKIKIVSYLGIIFVIMIKVASTLF